MRVQIAGFVLQVVYFQSSLPYNLCCEFGSFYYHCLSEVKRTAVLIYARKKKENKELAAVVVGIS